MVSAVNVGDAAGDQLGPIERQEGGRSSDIVDTHQAPGWRLGLRVVHEFVELGNSRSRPRRKRTGRAREALVSALNGVLGDYLAETRNPLAIEMTLRRDGKPLDPTRAALAAGIGSQGKKKAPAGPSQESR